MRANINIELVAVLFAKIHSDAIRDFEVIEGHGHNMHQLGHTAMDVFVRGVLSEEGLKLYNCPRNPVITSSRNSVITKKINNIYEETFFNFSRFADK